MPSKQDQNSWSYKRGAHLVFEFVVLAHVFMILALCYFATTLVHSAVLLELWLTEHTCSDKIEAAAACSFEHGLQELYNTQLLLSV